MMPFSRSQKKTRMCRLVLEETDESTVSGSIPACVNIDAYILIIKYNFSVKVPFITSSMVWLHLCNSNEWILFICWWLTPNHTHTECGGKFPQAGGQSSGRQTEREVLEQWDRAECRQEKLHKDTICMQWLATPSSWVIAWHDRVVDDITALTGPKIRTRPVSPSGVSWCFSRASVCGGSPVGMKAGCWSCMLARACW